MRGVDSNKLQPIIRHHNDKDFKVSFIDIEPMDYEEILGRKKYSKKNSKLMTKTEYSVEINNESENTEQYDLDGNKIDVVF